MPIININPVPKPRMTQSDKWKVRPAVARYRAFADELLLKVRKYRPTDKVDVVFIIPMPKSWSNKKRAEMNGMPHKRRPDIDNYAKAYMDALLEDDSHIYDLHAVKVWGEEGKIIINS